MQFVDSHAHLTSPELLPELEGLLKRAEAAHVSQILNICTDGESLKHGLLLAAKHPLVVKNAGATPPHNATEEGDPFFHLFEKAAREKQLCAIGETGLDYHYEKSPREIQKIFLKRYLELAVATNLPAIFHCRKAFFDLFSIADAHYRKPAIIHCFTGSQEEAEEALRRGWFLSFSGIVTFKNNDQLREIVKTTPLSQLLIETDSPFLAPQSRRGKKNEPAFLLETACCIAQVKGVPTEIIASASQENAKIFLKTQ